MNISSSYDHRISDYQCARVRHDRAWVELEQSPPPFIRWRLQCAVAVILLILAMVGMR